MTNQLKASVAALLAVILAVLVAIDQGWVEVPNLGPPPGKRVVVVLYETDEASWRQWALLHAIRSDPALEEHTVLLLDDDHEGPQMDALREFAGDVRPALIIGALNPDDPLKFKPLPPVYRLPDSVDEVVAIVRQSGG